MESGKPINGGIYLESIDSKVGTGDTAKNTTMENYWRVTIRGDGSFAMELLDITHQPTGYSEPVDMEEFAQRFVYQPDFEESAKDVKSEQADKISARGERHLQKKEYLSAEYEFNRALKLDEENVRANFGMGQTHMASGEPEKAKKVFQKLAQIEAVLEPRHKHIFNECGINLRKLGMHVEAVQYYKRALEISRGDENLWFNLGRALWEGGQAAQAAAALKRCLQLNPELEEAKVYLKQMANNKQ